MALSGTPGDGDRTAAAPGTFPDEVIDPDAPVRGRPPDRQWDVTLAVAIGGIVGAEARYGLSLAFPHAATEFPWSTVVANILGCFCLGVLMALLGRMDAPPRLLRPFAGIGILGGFTTFSTFAVDADRLIELHRPAIAGWYVLCTLVSAAAALLAATVATGRATRWFGGRRVGGSR